MDFFPFKAAKYKDQRRGRHFNTNPTSKSDEKDRSSDHRIWIFQMELEFNIKGIELIDELRRGINWSMIVHNN